MTPETRFSNGLAVTDVLADCLPGAIEEAKILNHHGLLSLRVVIAGKAYKVAECLDEERAVMAAQALQQVSACNGPGPEFVARRGAVIVAHWIEGALCKSLPLAEQQSHILECQTGLQRIGVVSANPFSRRYVHLETLSDRLRSEGAPVLGCRRIERVLANLWSRLPQPEGDHLIHPDLTPVNVVIAPQGPVIIDNEVIAMGVGREFDVWHSAEAIYGHRDHQRMQAYAEAYDKRCPGSTVLSHKDLWDDWRKLRRGLKSIQKKRYFKAARLLRQLPTD